MQYLLLFANMNLVIKVYLAFKMLSRAAFTLSFDGNNMHTFIITCEIFILSNGSMSSRNRYALPLLATSKNLYVYAQLYL